MVWCNVGDKYLLGIAKNNFSQEDKPHRLTLDVGDSVVIIKETTHWYYGYNKNNKAIRGIFPKSYIHLCECVLRKNEYCILRTDIVEEVTSVLREWGVLFKKFYLSTHEKFNPIRQKMFELIRLRSLLLSGNLPTDEMREIKFMATSEIDIGNSILGLDMVVRDESGSVLDIKSTCTTELYEHHLNAIERIRKATSPQYRSKLARSVNKYSHNILLTLHAFVCKFQEDSDLLFYLYDNDLQRPITENYVVKWGRQGIARDIEHFNKSRVIFTDLSSHDLQKGKVYLVCFAVRVGSMEFKDLDSKRASVTSSVLNSANKKLSQISVNSNGSFTANEQIRRPFGVAAIDLTPILKKPEDFRNNLDLPFILCEKDNLDSTLKKLILNKDIGKIESKLAISIEVLHGDLKQVKEELPHLVRGNFPCARKMGFPEVIFPGDVRNDLYLTLVSGEFSKGSKSSDKNIEVTVVVCNEKGTVVPGVMAIGAGTGVLDEYKSLVYYHEDKPKWMETFKVQIPIEEFKNCHLQFTFKHRSSNEQKDRLEKPFALSYVKLMQDNGTALKEGFHRLAVYKIDYKKYDKEFSLAYMDLPSKLEEIVGNSKPTALGFSLLSKDNFIIESNLCSTKLTQDVSLLGLLNWASHKEMLEASLRALNDVPPEEIVKFLQDILDALFNILVENDEPERYDPLVFTCLIRLIEIVSDLKYQHFQSVLDMYINESFSATLAYDKLINVLQNQIMDAINGSYENDVLAAENERSPSNRLYRTTKYLHYIIKFIIRSRNLFAALNDNKDSNEFEKKLEGLLESFVKMIACPNDLLKSEGALLKYLHIIASDLMQVYDPIKLSHSIVDIITHFPPGRLTQSKMMCIKDFVDTPLFHLPQCRAVLLPVFCKQVKDRLESKEEGDNKSDIWQQEKNLTKAAKVLGELKSQLHTRETTAKSKVSECVNIMNNILKLLFRDDVGSVENDIRDIMLILLRTVIQTSIAMDRENPLVGNLVAIMLGILRKMTTHHYDIYVKHFNTRYDLQDFLTEILLVFKDLVSKPVFPIDWMDMIMHQNTVILESLRHLSAVIINFFFNPFEKQVWSNFFQCSIAFLIQSPLQLDQFSENKRSTILLRYKDIRRETANEIQKMWFQLGEHKRQFVPQLVGPILEMSMIPEIELRRATIPIFFDMMQCEYYSSKYIPEGYGDTKRNNTHYKANFNEFETEMIQKLDILVEGGRGDLEFKELFHDIMMEHCSSHNTLYIEGERFVTIVTKLLERLLEYRFIIHDESKENRMACTVSLLQFYSEVNRKEMYIRYVYKLCDLHMEFDNYTEAAFTLKLHSNLLQWNDTELSSLLKSHRHAYCKTHRQLKEALYYDIIEYFDKGKMWECAIDMCKELAAQYENEVFDYISLSNIYKKMAQFFEKILKEMRHESEYFRVAFFGMKFPEFLRNKVFIYRGKEYERLSEFCTRILTQHPAAELMQTLTPPGHEITQADGQFIQINSVEPIMDDQYGKFQSNKNDKIIAKEIVKYYRTNNVQKFKFSRPYRDSKQNNSEVEGLWLERTILMTSYPLPGILRWFPVISSETFKISPIEHAIETMENTNNVLRELIIAHRTDENLPLNPLSMKINGIVDPAVMGGFNKYEEAFLTTQYLENNPADEHLVQKLKDLIAMQIPLLELALSVHRVKAPASLLPFHERLEKCFAEMQASVESKYGKKTSDLKFDKDNFVVLRRNGIVTQPSVDSCNRLSETSIGSSDSGLSKSTPGNRSQTSSIKSTFASFNFNAANLTRTSSSSPGSKGKIKDKNQSKRRSSKKIDRDALSLPVSNCQWYTSPPIETSSPAPSVRTSTAFSADLTGNSTSLPVVELTEELTPKRPLRSEAEKEKRASRPASIATPSSNTTDFAAPNNFISGGEKSNRDSIGTTDSTGSEENLIPPPLPAKARDSADFSSLGFYDMTLTRHNNSVTCILNSSYEYVQTRSIDVSSEDRKRPPTPPPKPCKNGKNIVL